MSMTPRERFLATMTYQSPDRIPLFDFNFWNETIPEWRTQGLAACWDRSNLHRYLGLDASLGGGDNADVTFQPNICVTLLPRFEREVVEDLENEQIVRQQDGVLVRVHKHHVSIPPHVGHTLVDRASWEQHYLPRLDPGDPNRLPDDLELRVADYMAGPRDRIACLYAGSLFGWLRDWMGMENIALVPYDDPAWFEAMVRQVADVIVATLEKVFDAGLRVDWCQMWEDMCFNSGPLLSPEFFVQYIVPQYRRITELCRAHGCQVVSVDCDGKIDALVPHWLDAGVNCMFPVEIGDWADPVRFRKQFGRELLMMGGFDKHILARSPQAIDAEIQRLTPLVEEGGFIPFCDHRVPPDVPLENYRHYCDRAREVWGKGIDLPEKVEDCETVGH